MGIQLKKLERKEFNKVACSFLPPVGQNGVKDDGYEVGLRKYTAITIRSSFSKACPYTTFDTVYAACFHIMEFIGYMRFCAMQSPDEIRGEYFGVGRSNNYCLRAYRQIRIFTETQGALVKSIKKYKTVII